MIGVKYTSACMDSSGYGSAARGYIGCLLRDTRIQVTVNPVSFESQKTSHGKLGETIQQYINKQTPYQYHIIHLTPDNFPSFIERSKYNIGYAAWETDKLPDRWADYCNALNEVWVPSDYNVEIFKKSGVTVPVVKIVHGVELPELAGVQPMTIGSSDTFTFYSIFQWLERKNPIGLLKAYLTEFQSGENVNLALKSYRLNTSDAEQNIIKSHVQATKKALNLEHYPPITFFGQLFPEEMIHSFHMRGDCFVLPVKSEGFGIPIAEAMLHGKPVITTRYGGALEFCSENNSYLVDYSITPVYGMLFNNYNGSMNWAEPDIMDIRKKMRYVFEHRDEAKVVGQRGKFTVANNLNWKNVASDIVNRLISIGGTV